MARSTSARPAKIKKEEVALLFLKVAYLKIQIKENEGPIHFYLAPPHTGYMLVVSLLRTPFKVPASLNMTNKIIYMLCFPLSVPILKK